MVKRKILLFSSVFYILLLVFSNPTLGVAKDLTNITISPTPVEYALPYPGILPDNPLYLIKVTRDRILQYLTKDPVKKIHLNLLLSDKRLVMGQLLWDKTSYDLAIGTVTKGEKYLLTSALELVKLKKQSNVPPGLSDKVDLSAKKHEEIIRKMISLTNDETYKKRLTDALGITHQAIQQVAASK